MKKFPVIWKMEIRYTRIIRFIVLAVILAIVIWNYTFPANVNIYWFEPSTTLNEEWTQVIDGQKYPLDQVQNIHPVAVGENIVLEHEIYMEENERHLLFYLEHQEVKVEINDKEVKSVLVPKGMEHYGSPGRLWVEVPILQNENGQTLRLTFSSEFKQYQRVPADIFWLEHDQIQGVQATKMWLRNTSAWIIFALAIISYVNAFLWKNRSLRRYFFAMADFFLVLALWLFAEVNILSIVLGRTATSSMLAMIFIRIAPIACYHMMMLSTLEKPWWLRISGILLWIHLASSIIGQFVFGTSLVAQLRWYTVLIVIVSFICFCGMLYQHLTQPQFRKKRRIYFVSIIMIISAFGEAICCLRQDILGQYAGVPVSVGSMLYAFIMHLILVHKESLTEVQKRELEGHYKMLQKKPLTSQINAHFLGNSLNTISAYCKEDPAKADRAVQLLAKYMREYMHLVNTGEYVSVEEELYLVQLYLEIQNVRFENAIGISIQNEFDDFELPPLCLQPLVENAFAHGIRTLERGTGMIHIEFSMRGNMGQVIIRDNGVGFEMDKTETFMGVSMTNIKARILEMGGIMNIESHVGQGTKVVLLVPLDRAWELEEKGEIL